MKATSGGERRTFWHDKPTHDGVTGTTQISKRTMPPLLRLDSVGEVSSVSFGSGERMGQHKEGSNRCHSVNKAVIATTTFLNNLVVRATPMSAHSAAPLAHGHHLTKKEEVSFLESRVVSSASTMATFEKVHVVKTSSPQSKDDRYGQWGKRYPLMPPGIFPCHVFSARQTQMQSMNLPKDWYSPFIAGNGIVGSVSDSVLDRLPRIATRRETSFSEVVNPKSPQMPTEERAHGVCQVPVNQTMLAESGAAMGEMCCDESTPSAAVLNAATDFSSCASSTSSSSKSQNSPQIELRGASSVDSGDDFTEEENDNGENIEVEEEEDDIIFDDSVNGAALPSSSADLNFNSDEDDDDDDGDEDDDDIGLCTQQLSEVKFDDSSDWDDDEDIDEERVQTIESCSFGLAFKSLANFLPGHKKCSSENILANNSWLRHYGSEQLPSKRSSVKVTFSCGKGVDQEIWYDKEAEEIFTPTFMELALEKKDGTHKSKAKKHCSS